MRRLVSKEEEEKRKKRNQTILVVILGSIMIFSTIGFAIQSNTGNPSGSNSANQTTYNGYKFTNQNGLWILGKFVFKNLPQQVPDIGFGLNPASSYQGKPAYVYSEDSGAEIEIMVNLGQIAQRVQKACPQNTNCSADIPVKTCADNFIIIKESSNNSITQDNNCVYIQGAKEQLVALTDQFLFKTLGVK